MNAWSTRARIPALGIESVHIPQTAPAYGFGMSERILGLALEGLRTRTVIATKTGLEWRGGSVYRNATRARIMRVPYDLCERAIEAEILPYCQPNDIMTLGDSALRRSLLSGHFQRRVIHLAVRWMLDRGISIAIWDGRYPIQVEVALGVASWSLDSTNRELIEHVVNSGIADTASPDFGVPLRRAWAGFARSSASPASATAPAPLRSGIRQADINLLC
jgi:aryl-alcohol dehydrogenase-like predicted oxidoreductase